MPRTAGAAHLERALARQLEHLPVQQEEPGEPEPSDQLQLVAQPLTRFRANGSLRRAVTLDECVLAELAQLHVGGIDAVREVRVAVAELLRQVELAAIGNLAGALRRFARQPLEHLRRRKQDAFVVAAPLALAAVERCALLDRNERVLQLCATRVVRMHVAGRNGWDTKRLGELGEHGVPPRVAALVRPLQLDVERTRKGAGEPRRRVRSRRRRAHDARNPRARRALRRAPRRLRGSSRAAADRVRDPAGACAHAHR